VHLELGDARLAGEHELAPVGLVALLEVDLVVERRVDRRVLGVQAIAVVVLAAASAATATAALLRGLGLVALVLAFIGGAFRLIRGLAGGVCAALHRVEAGTTEEPYEPHTEEQHADTHGKTGCRGRPPSSSARNRVMIPRDGAKATSR
jgi:hypothetical protein